MKFLCPNCKAKYQIADDKVGGRTLKMDCRKCKHTIVLRREQQSPSEELNTGSARPGRPAPRPAARSESGSGLHGNRRSIPRSNTSAGLRTAPRSALGADFKRGGASIPPLPPEAPRPTPLDQWHVAINEVPVGPMRREEVARKIASGAVTAGSLAWREGFDDWRPIGEIPDLAPLLKKNEEARRLGMSARPPAGRIPPIGGRGASPRPGARPVRPAPPDAARARGANVVPLGRAGNTAPALEEEDLDGTIDAEPTRVAHMAALSEEMTTALPGEDDADGSDFAALSAESSVLGEVPADSHESEDDDEIAAAILPPVEAGAAIPPVSTPPSPEPSPPAPVAGTGAGRGAEEERERKPLGLPIGVWIAIAGASAFGIMLAFLVAPRLVGSSGSRATATVAEEREPAPVEPPPETEPELEIPELEPEETLAEESPEEETAAEEEDEEEATETVAARGASTRRRRPTRNTPPTASAETTRSTSSSDDEDTDWGVYSSDSDPTPRPIPPRRGGSTGGSSGPSASGLEPAQITRVIRREQRGLQGCWEVAIRGMSDVPTVRMDIDISIGTSGTVTRANARGPGLGNLSTCLERNVRRWRFPTSSGTSQASFPVVFQGTN